VYARWICTGQARTISREAVCRKRGIVFVAICGLTDVTLHATHKMARAQLKVAICVLGIDEPFWHILELYLRSRLTFADHELDMVTTLQLPQQYCGSLQFEGLGKGRAHPNEL
jgi:hypothetical protein